MIRWSKEETKEFAREALANTAADREIELIGLLLKDDENELLSLTEKELAEMCIEELKRVYKIGGGK